MKIYSLQSGIFKEDVHLRLLIILVSAVVGKKAKGILKEYYDKQRRKT